jgi:hypothetical protein
VYETFFKLLSKSIGSSKSETANSSPASSKADAQEFSKAPQDTHSHSRAIGNAPGNTHAASSLMFHPPAHINSVIVGIPGNTPDHSLMIYTPQNTPAHVMFRTHADTTTNSVPADTTASGQKGGASPDAPADSQVVTAPPNTPADSVMFHSALAYSMTTDTSPTTPTSAGSDILTGTPTSVSMGTTPVGPIGPRPPINYLQQGLMVSSPSSPSPSSRAPAIQINMARAAARASIVSASINSRSSGRSGGFYLHDEVGRRVR